MSTINKNRNFIEIPVSIYEKFSFTCWRNQQQNQKFQLENPVQFGRRAKRGGKVDISEVVDPAGFEPATSSLQMRRSSQLNYRPIYFSSFGFSFFGFSSGFSSFGASSLGGSSFGGSSTFSSAFPLIC